MNPGPMLDHCQCSDTLVNFLSLRRQIFGTRGCGPGITAVQGIEDPGHLS